MHYTAGLILSLVFQLAHVMEDAEMPKPDETGTMKNTWAIHQLSDHCKLFNQEIDL